MVSGKLRQIFSSKLKYSRATAAGILGIFVLALLLPIPAHANIVSDAVINLLAGLLLLLAQGVGAIANALIGILVEIVQYNGFIDAPAVVKGWVVMRDVVNMFFIVILLAISFGTVFRVEEYQYKHLLSKLLIMAVLVNFSKGIAGFFIDFAQVVMLTFVNGFKDAATGNFINGFHIKDMFQFAEKGSNQTVTTTGSDFFFAAALALITITIATIVVGVYIVVFTLRIVMLWLLVIISPAAYILQAFPGDAKKYASQWWDYFGKYASSGPILAFFLWLSLAVMQMSGGSTASTLTGVSTGTSGLPAATITSIGQSEVLLSFIVSIMLLLGGLWMTQQLGVAGGKLAGSAMSAIQKGGSWMAKKSALAPFSTYSWAARKAGAGKVPGFKWLKGYELNPVKAWKNVKEGFATKKHKEEGELHEAAAANIAQGGVRGLAASLGSEDIGDNLQGFLYLKTIRGIFSNAKKTEGLQSRQEKLNKESSAESKSETAIKHVLNGGVLANSDLQKKVIDQKSEIVTRKAAGEKEEDIMDDVMRNKFTAEERKILNDEGSGLLKKRQEVIKREVEELGKDTLTNAQKEQRGKIIAEIQIEIDKEKKDITAKEARGEDTTTAKENLKEMEKRKKDMSDFSKLTNNEKKDKENKILELNNESANLQYRLETPELTLSERKDKRRQAEEVGKKIEREGCYRLQNYYATAAGRAHVNEEKKKITTTNEDELKSRFRDALNRGDSALGQAIMARATEVGHLNEILEDQGYKTNIDGLHKFMNEVMGHKFHMKEQSYLSLENDLSNVAEDKGWWTFGQAVSMDNGLFKQRDRETQKQRCYVEIGKRDMRTVWRQSNRGAWMDEEPIDPNDLSKGRKAVLNEMGVAYILEHYSELKTHMREANGNMLENMNSEDNMKVLKQIGIKIELEAQSIQEGAEKYKATDPEEYEKRKRTADRMREDWNGKKDKEGKIIEESGFMPALLAKINSIPSKKGGVPAKEAYMNADEVLDKAKVKTKTL
jgi:hypothetical protein